MNERLKKLKCLRVEALAEKAILANDSLELRE